MSSKKWCYADDLEAELRELIAARPRCYAVKWKVVETKDGKFYRHIGCDVEGPFPNRGAALRNAISYERQGAREFRDAYPKHYDKVREIPRAFDRRAS